MSELVDAPNSFYINASQYNSSDEPVPATIQVEDRQDILKQSSGWMVNVVRWTVDTQSTLNYLPADSTATLTMELFDYTAATQNTESAQDIKETRTFILNAPQSTVSEFLTNLNQNVPQYPVATMGANGQQLGEVALANLRFFGGGKC